MTSTRFQAFSLIALGVAVLAMVIVQFVPWAVSASTFSSPGFNMFGFQQPPSEGSTTQTAHMWSGKFHMDGSMGTHSERESWYSDDWETRNGLWQGVAVMRWAAPFGLVTLSGLLAAAVLVALDLRRAAVVAGAVSSLFAVTTFILTVIGVNGFYAHNSADPTWHVGLYIGILGLLGAVAGMVLAMVPSVGYGLRQRIQVGLSS